MTQSNNLRKNYTSIAKFFLKCFIRLEENRVDNKKAAPWEARQGSH